MDVRQGYRNICHSTVAGALVTMAGNPSRLASCISVAGARQGPVEAVYHRLQE
jgi:hypothetical protein